MENEKSDFSDKKDAIETEHAAMKESSEKVPDQAREEAEKKLDDQRGTTDAAMDRAREETLKKMQKERSTTKSEPTMTGGSKASDDAFDELRRRRGE
jgi:F0F1-type ATP synthase membrane subunit b/b'